MGQNAWYWFFHLGGLEDLAGTTNGAATATAALTRERQLAGTSNGAATVSGALSEHVPLAGTSGGTASVSGALSVDRALSTTIAGVATVIGDMQNEPEAGAFVDLEGAVVCGSTVVGDLQGIVSLFGVSSGRTTVTGNGTLHRAMAVRIAGSTTMNPTRFGRSVETVDKSMPGQFRTKPLSIDKITWVR